VLIAYEKYKETCLKLFSTVEEDLKTLRDDRRKTVLLVGLHRGGNIPVTLLDYHLNASLGDKVDVRSTVLDLKTSDAANYNVSLLNFSVKKHLGELLDFQAESDDDLNFRVYFIDDLLDSGGTVNLLDSYLEYNKYFWYNQSKIICLFDRCNITEKYPYIYPGNKMVVEYLRERGKLLTIEPLIDIDPKEEIKFWYENLKEF
jgi:hypoxanthine phosphoribosyltransferase